MDKTLFDDLLQSLQEAGAIAKGTAKPSRQFTVTVPYVKAVREAPCVTVVAASINR